MIISDNWGELLLPGLRSIFEKQIKKGKDFIPLLFNVENSTKAQEFSLGTGELGLMDDWETSGGKISYEDFNKGFKSTYTHRKYSKGIQIERELLDDDQYATIKKRVRKLATVGFNTTQAHAASLFNNATSGGYLGPDEKPLCATDHPIAPGSSATWSNLGTYTLDAENVENTRTAMKGWKDDKGNPIDINPDTIIVPTALRKTAMIIAETAEEPFTTDHGINIWKGNLDVIEWHRLDDTNGWFIADMERMKLFLNWYWRRKLDFKDKVEFDDEVSKYAVLGRWSWGWDDPSFIYYNNPS